MPDAIENSINRRYLLQEKLGQGGMGTVYRAVDRLSAETVALKQVIVPSEKLQFASQTSPDKSHNFRLALAREFKTLASLRHPHIVSVLDYGFDAHRQPFLTMELLKDAPTLIEAGRDLQQPQQINFLVQLLQALSYMHQRGVIHRDLKPDNVLVTEDQVKVLDFGLAVARAQGTEQGGAVYGTPAYMAPEVFDGEPASESSDLYAVGLMAYELFAGHHPFDTTNLATLVQDIMMTTPDVDALKLEAGLAQVLKRLLAKNPAERYSDAREIINLYAEVTNQPHLVMETRAIHDSYLQAAEFIGRDPELTQLVEGLTTIQSGQGSAFLIGGESGVGKSRLLDEFRTLALVEGVQVIWGQAISEGGRPFQVWQTVLRWLSLQDDLSLEEGSILKPFVPDIETFQQKTIPSPPPLEPQQVPIRLFHALHALFKRQTTPLVLILEDLQWAGNESIEMLKRLSQLTPELPLMIIGNYRDDEAPKLSETLSAMRSITLHRFEADEIVALGTAMLGEAGQRQDIVELLQRETEGNVFFLVEVVRTLAEQAGQLAHIKTMTLPKQVFAGGIQAVVQRRLQQMPAETQPLLQRAAIAGRRLDLTLLRAHIAQGLLLPEFNLGHWLILGTDAAVLEPIDETWRFAHDKLREQILQTLPDEQRLSLYQDVAETIEQCYPVDPDQAARLAHLWGEVGNDEKELHYLQVAGEQALGNGANVEAIAFLERAIPLAQQLDRPKPQRALLAEQLGQAYNGLGRVIESTEHLTQALALLGYVHPATRGQQIWGLLKQVIRQGGRRLRIDLLDRQVTTQQNPAHLLIAARASERLTAQYFIQNEKLLLIYYSLQALNLAEQAGSMATAEQARLYTNVAIGAGLDTRHGLAEMYLSLADRLSQAVDDPYTKAWTEFAGAVYLSGRGRWDEVLSRLGQSIDLAKHSGDWRLWEQGTAISSEVVQVMGHWERAVAQQAELHPIAVQEGNIQGQGVSLAGQGVGLLRLGQHKQALTLIRQSLPLLEQSNDQNQIVRAPGLLAQIHLRLGNMQRAQQYAEQGMKLMTQSSPVIFFMLEGYAGVAEFYLTFWEHQPSETHQKQAQAALKLLQNNASIFDIGQPRLFAYQCWFNHLANKSRRALKAGQKAIQTAQSLKMPYEEGIAHYQLGRHLPHTNPERQQHLSRAVEIFSQLGAVYDLEQAHACAAEINRVS